MHRRLFALVALALVLAATLAVACGDDDDAGEVEQITFVAGFRPQANLPFVAVYVAVAKSYFADEGLEVTVEHSPSGGHLQLLLEKEIAFTTSTAAQVIRRRADELPVQAIALFGQGGDQGYVVKADSGITGPADFAGRSVGFKGSVVPAELKAMLATVGLTIDDVNLQNVPFDVRPFIEGQVDVFPVFLNNEPFQIQQQDVEITIIDPTDFGVPSLGLTFIAHQDTVSDNAQLVERFLRSALRGVEFAAHNIDEAVEITLQYAEGADPVQQRFLLETDLANAQRADGIGRTTAEQWRALTDLLLQYEVIEADIDVLQAFSGSFADALYDGSGRLK
ncbi:MAG TPA: ABC transporter substrate-binding protein [Dehalococcoidia bacterium]|jgi:ABC-type nitrate/sulfonate/bicarbonate transport system substrate-binding protein|nr:ABC transporter substrate-binding protein [Dehalococcoidia bacterium]